MIGASIIVFLQVQTYTKSFQNIIYILAYIVP